MHPSATPRRRTLRPIVLLVLLQLVLFGTGCAWLFPNTPMTTVHPTTEVTRWIQSVYELTTWWVVGIFVVVEGIAIYAALRFRRKEPDSELPIQTHGNTGLEVGWTLAPLVPIVMVMVASLQTTCALQRPEKIAGYDERVKITVTGKQWWWAVEYPELGVVTANEIHVPVGKMADFWLQSDNIIHSFWVPRLAGKRDMVPSRGQSLWFVPEEVGVYQGQCAELCGASHANMRFQVVVDTQEDFDAWVEKQKSLASSGPTDPGQIVFLQGGCFVCHSVRGAQGMPPSLNKGPDLTHVGTRMKIAAGILDNTPENMKKWIANVNDFKPGFVPSGVHYDKMPVFSEVAGQDNIVLTDQQLNDVVAWLQNLK